MQKKSVGGVSAEGHGGFSKRPHSGACRLQRADQLTARCCAGAVNRPPGRYVVFWSAIAGCASIFTLIMRFSRILAYYSTSMPLISILVCTRCTYQYMYGVYDATTGIDPHIPVHLWCRAGAQRDHK
jgi:hypothetical protein